MIKSYPASQNAVLCWYNSWFMKPYKYLFWSFLVICLLVQPGLGLNPSRAQDQPYPGPATEPTATTPGLANNPRLFASPFLFPGQPRQEYLRGGKL